MRLRFALCLMLALGTGVATPAFAADDTPRIHTVYSGQRLGSIAKRYGVTVEAICNANGINRNDRIKPGQKLVIPARSDKDGSRARAAYAPKKKTTTAKGRNELGSTSGKAERAKTTSEPRTHTVYSGQRLESIAKRYHVTIDDLCKANGIDRKDILRPGQVLVIPRPGEPVERLKRGDRVDDYRPVSPKRKGYVELFTYSARWSGQLVDKKGRLREEAAKAVSRLLGATGKRPPMDPRLIRLLAQVSDRFGGRPIRIVSGYRTQSYYDDSRHKVSRAVDFSIPGVPNSVVRDYLRTLRNVGVGYYPNSSFVHLDVRDGAAYWVDYAGPGEPPRDKQHAEDVGDSNLERELGKLLEKNSDTGPTPIEYPKVAPPSLSSAAPDAPRSAPSSQPATE